MNNRRIPIPDSVFAMLLLAFLWWLALPTGILSAEPENQASPITPAQDGKTWRLVLDENFDAPALDPAIWNIEEGNRNDAMNSASAVDIKDGKLILTTYTGEDGVNRCGFVTTRGKLLIRKGKVVARLRYSATPGSWAAFWLQSPTNGKSGDPAKASEDGVEIDIVESLGNMAGGYQSVLHWGGYGKGHRSSKQIFREPVGGEWHEYGVEWDETGYRFTFDGNPVWKDDICPPTSSPEFLMFTTETNGKAAKWCGSPPPGGFGTKDKSPNVFEIDWVKAWERVPVEK